jgi:hypothetical protein
MPTITSLATSRPELNTKAVDTTSIESEETLIETLSHHTDHAHPDARCKQRCWNSQLARMIHQLLRKID